MTTDRRKWIHRRVVPWQRVEVPEASMRFAMKRVSYLEGRALHETLNYLLACAYLQGVSDCAQAHAASTALSAEALRASVALAVDP